MSKSYVLSKIEDVVTLATKLSRSWWRGQPKCYNNLTPRVFRQEYNEETYINFRPEYEFTIMELFKRKAPALEKNLPKDEDDLGWLFLMQHHGAPTRLLDWTESALVALFFVIRQYPKEDGELWGMYPQELNKKYDIPGLPTKRNKFLRFLAKEPSSQNSKALAESLGIDKTPNYPIAFEPTMNFPRMINQNSVFTIHPKPDNGNCIPEILSEPKYLIKYVVPSESKNQLRKDLKALCFEDDSLFPDLDSLSKTIIYEHETVAYGPPEPPEF